MQTLAIFKVFSINLGEGDNPNDVLTFINECIKNDTFVFFDKERKGTIASALFM
jgi:hypothetical protein